jgi:hypothetical protein
VSNTDGPTTVRTTNATTTTTTTTGRSGLQTYGSMTTPAPNRLSDSKRDRLYNILRRSKKTETFPSPSAPTSTSIGQQTSTPLAPASASHKQLASNKLTSAIPLTSITSDTTLIPTKAALIPVSSSLSSTSQIATVQQSTPVSQQRIGTVTNLCIVSNISFDNT